MPLPNYPLRGRPLITLSSIGGGGQQKRNRQWIWRYQKGEGVQKWPILPNVIIGRPTSILTANKDD